MSEGLEALKLIKLNCCTFEDRTLYQNEFAAIEKELKALEKLEEEKQSFDRQLEKKLKALNEILSLHDKWLGNEMSDFEFFTLLSEIKDKYGLSKEVLL